TISTSSAFAARTGQEVRGNQEMVGIGAANVAASFFQGFPVSTSGSRTAVAEQAGARSQLTGVVGAVTITLMLVLVPGLLKDLPQPTLGAVVIAASLSLADLAGTTRLWHQRRTEFSLSIAAFLGVALLGVPRWIVVAAEPMTDVDTTAADMLADLDVELNAAGISLVFAEMKTPVQTKIERYELTRTIDPAHFFPTVDDAVHAYRERTGTHWV